MTTRTARLVVLCGFLTAGVGVVWARWHRELRFIDTVGQLGRERQADAQHRVRDRIATRDRDRLLLESQIEVRGRRLKFLRQRLAAAGQQE